MFVLTQQDIRNVAGGYQLLTAPSIYLPNTTIGLPTFPVLTVPVGLPAPVLSGALVGSNIGGGDPISSRDDS